MKRFSTSSLSALIAACLTLGVAGSANAEHYVIDSAHSEVNFSVRHLGISNVTGRFDSFAGSFDYDPKNVAASKAEATIDIASVDTNQAKRDTHLKECDFFCAAQFQKIKFVTTAVKSLGDNKLKITGNLTIRDVTKPVELDAEFNGVAKHFDGKNRAAFSATGKINRLDYGLSWNKLTEAGGIVVSPEVKISLEIQGIEEKKS